MGDRDDQDLICELDVDDREWEALHHEPADIAPELGRLPCTRVLRDESNGLADGGEEFGSETITPQFVTRDLVDQLASGSTVRHVQANG